MNRRSFLGALAASSVPVAVEASTIETPAQRMDAAFSEIRAAIRAYDPSIERIDIVRNEDDIGGNQCRYMVLAYNFA